MASSSTLNLTVNDDITISYTRRGAAALPATCVISVRAPPGKVLSILFLNQTCSRDTHVRIQDFLDGWSPTLDGCSPWIPPGYDVTTADGSAALFLDTRIPLDVGRRPDTAKVPYELTVQLKAVRIQRTGDVIARYVSPVLGYIQTPSWHPFGRPFTGVIQGTVAIRVPENHSTMISSVYHFMTWYTSLTLVKLQKDRKRPREVWRVGGARQHRPGAVVLSALSEFRVSVDQFSKYSFYGVRLLFSIHQSLLSPTRYTSGLWNCSAPSWPGFQQHFMCNGKTECSLREDEMQCPDTACRPGGVQLNGICYTLFRVRDTIKTLHHADVVCRKNDVNLATFKTVRSWFHLGLLSQMREYADAIYIGLQVADKQSHPHMYRHTLQWFRGPLAHYVTYQLRDRRPPTFFHLRGNLLTPQARVQSATRTGPKFALCNGRNWGRQSIKEVRSNPFKTHVFERLPFPSVSCPDQHKTHDFLACDALSACWREVDLRSSGGMAGASPVPSCGDDGAPSFKALFQCREGAGSVPYSLVCNHLQDCADLSDEDFCVFPPCSSNWQFSCANRQCLRSHEHCDEIVQCVDESDEADCSSKFVSADRIISSPRPPAVADFDGRGRMVYAPMTLQMVRRGAAVCPDTHMFCPGDGYCLPVYVRCNGVYDCPGLEDETDCGSFVCPGLYRCRGFSNVCLHPAHLCDGWPQCPQHDDELFCNLTCPFGCTCLGHAFVCSADFHVGLFSQLRYLDASGTGLQPRRLFNNYLLVHLSLARCHLRTLDHLVLPNLLSLNLDNNIFSAVNVADIRGLNSLRSLSLAGNPLRASMVRKNPWFVHSRLRHLDMSGAYLPVLHVPEDLPFPSLLSLNLSNTGLRHLIGDGFRPLASLRSIDLRGCPMFSFPRRIFTHLEDLRLVLTDNYKLCCKGNLPQKFKWSNCMAPANEISSCDALLRTNVYRGCLAVLAALAVSGNLGCFCLRVFSVIGRGKTGFNVFVTHLCVSDFVMGVYMAMIGVADRLYLGAYLWEDDRWRHSLPCKMAGVLALLSSEVSAFVICLITLDRFLVIRFPFSRLRFSAFSAQVASLVTWAIGVALVIIPLLPMMAYRDFYSQSGICIPLPITRASFRGHSYSFAVMILLNLALFILIATGQISIYLSMRNNAMSSIDAARKSRDLIVARRLITVVVTDFLCWFPIGLLGVLAANGLPVPGELNVAIAIFVLPLNSALNPFLYTLNVIREKRRRATEMKLLKMLIDLGIRDDDNTEHIPGTETTTKRDEEATQAGDVTQNP